MAVRKKKCKFHGVTHLNPSIGTTTPINFIWRALIPILPTSCTNHCNTNLHSKYARFCLPNQEPQDLNHCNSYYMYTSCYTCLMNTVQNLP